MIKFFIGEKSIMKKKGDFCNLVICILFSLITIEVFADPMRKVHNKNDFVQMLKSEKLYSSEYLLFNESLKYYREYYFNENCKNDKELNAVAFTKILVTRLLGKAELVSDPISFISHEQYSFQNWQEIKEFDSESFYLTSQVLLNTLDAIRKLPNWEIKLSNFTVHPWRYDNSNIYYRVENNLKFDYENSCLEDMRYWLLSFWKRRLLSENLVLTENMLKKYSLLSSFRIEKEHTKEPLLIVDTTCYECLWNLPLDTLRDGLDVSSRHWTEPRWTDWFSISGGYIYDISMFKDNPKAQEEEVKKILNRQYEIHNVDYLLAAPYRYPDDLGLTFDYMVFNKDLSKISFIGNDHYIEIDYHISDNEDVIYGYIIVSSTLNNAPSVETQELYKNLSARIERSADNISFPPLFPLINFERTKLVSNSFIKKNMTLCLINDNEHYTDSNQYNGLCHYWSGNGFQGFIFESNESYTL